MGREPARRVFMERIAGARKPAFSAAYFYTNLPGSRPTLTLTASARLGTLGVLRRRVLPRPDKYNLPVWLFSCKVQSPGSARRIYIEVDFTKRCEMRADSLQPLFVPCGLGTVRKENCAPPAGQKGDMKTASLIRRQKNADFGTKSAAVGRPLPAATGNRSPLQIPCA